MEQLALKSSPEQSGWRSLFYLLISLGIFYVLWWLFIAIINGFQNQITILPYPNEVITAFITGLYEPLSGATLLDHVGASFFRVLVGTFYAFMIAVPLGLILGSYSGADRIGKPIIEILRPIPPIAWIPFAIIAFGIGLLSYGFIIFIGAFFPLLQNAYDGVKQSPRVYQDVGRSLGASRLQSVFSILFPSILPNIFTGLRVSMGVGWMCVIAAEMIGVTNAGIGYFINYTKLIGLYADMMAGMLMIGLVGLIINYVFKLAEKIVLRGI